jgi:peptidoglycan/xylan/chitin deacetylase (PgdA/CDA1 family)
MKLDKQLSISSVRGFHRMAVALSFDFESTAPYGSRVKANCKVRGRLMRILNRFRPDPADLSFCFGMGYAMRHGADNIIRILQAHGIHATWFATGHVLLKDNRHGNAFRINNRLPYALPEAGFTDIVTWRQLIPTFHYEPYSDYHHYPYWYMGDEAQRLREMGEDIQCHTFSHSYTALEPVENVKVDIEDWQNAARHNGFQQANIFAFPFGGDAYRHYPEIGLNTMLSTTFDDKDGDIVCLSTEATEVLAANGIELVTRCASKHDKYGCFSRYGDSNVRWMPDAEYNPRGADISEIERFIEKMAALGGAPFNIWMHPCNVFSKTEILGFEKLVEYLAEKKRRGDIWLATISELWSHHKKASLCSLCIAPRTGRSYDVAVKNGNASDVDGLGLDMNGVRYRLIRPDRNIGCLDSRICIGHLSAGETYKFKVRIDG